MFKPYKLQSNVLEVFRIKAHLRSYAKDPNIIDQDLMLNAVEKLKKLPYENKDPTDIVAKELVIDAYHLSHFKYEDLTHPGYIMVQQERFRRHPPLNDISHQIHMLRNRIE